MKTDHSGQSSGEPARRRARSEAGAPASTHAGGAEALAAVARTLAETLDAAEVGERIVHSLLSLFDVQSSSLRRVDADGSVVALAWAGRAREFGFVPGYTTAPGIGVVGRAVASARPIQTPDLFGEPDVVLPADTREQIAAANDRAFLAVPLRAQGAVIGVLTLSDPPGRVFTDSEVALAQAVADQARLALENARLYGEAARRGAEAEALVAVARTLTETLSVEEVGQRIVESVLPLFRARTATIRLLQADGSLVRLAATAGHVFPHVHPPNVGMIPRAIAHGRVVWTRDVLNEPGLGYADVERAAFTPHNRAVLAAPLRTNRGILGGLVFNDDLGREFSDAELTLAQAFADQASLALGNALQFEEVTRRRREAEKLAAVARTLTGDLDVATVSRQIADSIHELLPGCNTSVVSALRADGVLAILAATGPSSDVYTAGRAVPAGAMSDRALREGRPIWTANIVDDPDLALPDDMRAALAAVGMRAGLGLPLEVRGRPIGVLALGFGPRGPLSAEEMALVRAFADQAAIALDNARVYADLRQTQEQLVQSQKMEAIGRLAGGVAHDFNNILTIILGRAEMLRLHLDKQNPLGRDVDLIAAAAERAAALTQQLLAFSRRQVLQPQTFLLGDLVVRMGMILRRVIGEDVELGITTRSADGFVHADPVRLEQVVFNLAVNARDAMPHGGRLSLETDHVGLDAAFCRRHEGLRPGPYVTLSIRDTGVGIDPALHARIFEPFFTTKEVGQGSGLGLSMVLGNVQQSGGAIAVDSTPGAGTTFTIFLPRVRAAMADPATPAAAPMRLSAGTETILLVEDEEEVRELARDILLECGYEVLSAPDGAAALRIAEAWAGDIDLLLTDAVMPGLSGREVAERLRPARPRTRVLYMSGYTDDAVIRYGVNSRGPEFLQKPFTPGRLADVVRAALDAQRA